MILLCLSHVCVFIRELEGLIFQCGLHLEELKEQMGQNWQVQPTCEAPPSPPPQSTLLSAPPEEGDTLTQPQVQSNSFFCIYVTLSLNCTVFLNLYGHKRQKCVKKTPKKQIILIFFCCIVIPT